MLESRTTAGSGVKGFDGFILYIDKTHL